MVQVSELMVTTAVGENPDPETFRRVPPVTNIHYIKRGTCTLQVTNFWKKIFWIVTTIIHISVSPVLYRWHTVPPVNRYLLFILISSSSK